MKHWKLKLSLLLNFLVLALLLNSVGAVALQVQRVQGISESAAGLLAGFKSCGIVAASFGAMIFLTRIGYRRAMLCSLGALTLACLIVPSRPEFSTMKLLFVIAGAAFATIKVSVYATIGLVTQNQKEHAGFMSFLESFFTFGVVAGYFLFSAFTSDTEAHAHAWLQVFYVLGGLSFVAWLLLLSAPLDETRVRAERAWREELRRAFRLSLTELVLLFGGCVFLYVMIEQSTMNWLPTFNRKVLQMPPRLSIQMAGLLTIAFAVGRLVAGFVLRRFAWFPVLAVCLASSAVLVVVALSFVNPAEAIAVTGWSNVPLSAFLFPLIGLFVAPIYPAINSVVLSTLPLREHAPMASVGVIFSACGSSLGTIGVGYLFEAYGGHSAVYFVLIPIAGLFSCLWLFYRRTKRAIENVTSATTLARAAMDA